MHLSRSARRRGRMSNANNRSYTDSSCHLCCQEATEADCQDEQHDIARHHVAITVRTMRAAALLYGCVVSRFTGAYQGYTHPLCPPCRCGDIRWQIGLYYPSFGEQRTKGKHPRNDDYVYLRSTRLCNAVARRPHLSGVADAKVVREPCSPVHRTATAGASGTIQV